MFTLVTDKSRFYRVKQGQGVREVENTLSTPVNGEAFAGAVVPVFKGLKVYCAKVGDTYKTLAGKFATDAEELKRINGGRPVYPTCRIFVP